VNSVYTASNVTSDGGVIVVPGVSTNHPLQGYRKKPKLRLVVPGSTGQQTRRTFGLYQDVVCRNNYDKHDTHFIDR
jgi:hypothetical protein